jgi:pimeloyl-ACP methyl ester carboxylesterase
MTSNLVISIVLIFCLQCCFLNSSIAQEIKPSSKFDTLQVDVDNHKMSMYVSGTGKYTVVLEAGGSSNHNCWRTIDTAITKITRVISYDRPGYLKSEVCEKTRDAVTIAKELKEALQKSGYPPPYILVGWSMGGAFARVFCGLYPESVAGLILVDPTPEDVYARAAKEFPEVMAEDSIYMKEIMNSKNRPGERGEMIVFDSSMNQARRSDASHSTPTTLLIAAYGKALGEFENDPNHPMNGSWVEELVKWAGKRPNLQYKVISNSGHHIAKLRPEVVLYAISEMILQLK